MKKNLLILNFFSLFLFFVFFGAGNSNAAITGQPASVTVCSGAKSIGFNVTASLPLGYQWQAYDPGNPKGGWQNLTDITDLTGISIAGSTTAKLTLTFAKPGIQTTYNGLMFHCVVLFSKLVTETSNAAAVTVLAAPVITSSPASSNVVDGQPASFSVAASGSNLSYQWQLSQDGGSTYTDITGATSTSLTLTAVTIKDAGLYRCYVSNGVCTVRYSSAATLTVFPVLVIDKHPGKASGCEGKYASFSVSSNATYFQWEVFPPKGKVWEPIAEATSATYTIDPLTTSLDGAQYHCIVSDNAGQVLTSKAGILYVNANVAIYSSPASASKLVGESVTFNCTATGSIQSYQWKLGSTNVGTNSSSYTIASVQLADAGNYTCVVTGVCNAATSAAATLTVTAATYENGWVKQTSGSSLNITTVSAITDLKAWALTSDPNKLLKTIDGGAHWTAVNTDNNYGYWHSIHFISDLIGMVGGYNGVSRTVDGGTTWTSVDLKTQFALGTSEQFYIESFHFRDASNGWAVGSNGIIIKTTDGGATWTKRSYKTDASAVTDIGLYSVYFVDANNGYIGGLNGKLYKTVDGGTNWTELVSGTTTYPINDIVFLTATKGFYAASYGGLFATTNGTNWTQVKNEYVNSIDFVDANNGWAAGQAYIGGSYKGRIIKTFDGGTTWVIQKIDNLYPLNEIRMVDANHGWVVGNGGEIYVTGKGGCYDPVVSLYADQTLCANQSYTLRADTFSNNYNSRYLWSTTASTGSITVNTTANYSVTITNECGKTATDNATITFLDLPVANAGDDVAICQGESTQLSATGGSGYSWNNAGYLDDHLVPNPVATPPTGQTTTFTVTVTDDHGCSKTDAVAVTVNPLPTSDFTAPAYVCGTSDGTFTYTGSAAGKTFNWDFNGGNISSGSNAGPIHVNWADLGDKLVSLTTIQNNCSSTQTVKVVGVREQPTSEFNTTTSTCGSSPAVLIYTGSAPESALYSWEIDGGTITDGSGQGPLQVSWATQGKKALSLSVTQNECVSDVTNKNVIVSYPYEGEQICLVTVDLETGKNMVVWEKTHNVGIASYNVYREGNSVGNYDLLGNVPFDDVSLYVDLTSKPEQQQYKYKISAVDTCGNESSKSPWHKTMLLQYAGSVSGVNLTWQEYQTETGSINFASYDIFRGSDSTALTQINTISASFLAYTDNTPDALSRKMYYRVGGVKAIACDPAEIGGKKTSSGPFVHSLSNLEDNRMQATGVSNVYADALHLSIYPSPFTDVTSVNYTLQKQTKMKVEVYNVVGEKIATLLDETQSAGSHKLEMKAADVNYTNGVYYLRFVVDNVVIVRKTMLSR